MSSAAANALDKLKTSQGYYIWRAGITSGAPPSLLGRPVEFDENMPAIGSRWPSVWKAGYLIVDKLGIRYLRDPFTTKPNVLFYAYPRVGGDVANSDAIKLLKIST
jgi:HK97 family phage major capsid protein